MKTWHRVHYHGTVQAWVLKDGPYYQVKVSDMTGRDLAPQSRNFFTLEEAQRTADMAACLRHSCDEYCGDWGELSGPPK